LPRLVRAFSNSQLKDRAGALSQVLLAARALRAEQEPGLFSTGSSDQSRVSDELGVPLESTLSDLRSMVKPEAVAVESDAFVSQWEAAKLLFAADTECMLLPQTIHTSYKTDPNAARCIVNYLLQMQYNNFTMSSHGQLAAAGCAEACAPLTALLNHSCEPNAVVVWHFPAIPGEHVSHTVRCIRPLQTGSEVLIAYVDASRPWWVRQPALQKSHGFMCSCTICCEISEYKRLRSAGGCSRPSLPKGVSASISSVANRAGAVMLETVAGDAALRKLLEVEMGAQITPANPASTNALAMALRLFGALPSTTSSAQGTALLPTDAQKLLEKMDAPTQVLLRLLGPRNQSVSESLQRVLFLAEVCSDWARCLFLAPLVLASMDPVMPLRRADILALEAKAMANNHLENKACTFADKVTACKKALSMFDSFHGPFANRLPRACELRLVLQKLRTEKGFGEVEQLYFDEMD